MQERNPLIPIFLIIGLIVLIGVVYLAAFYQKKEPVPQVPETSGLTEVSPEPDAPDTASMSSEELMNAYTEDVAILLEMTNTAELVDQGFFDAIDQKLLSIRVPDILRDAHLQAFLALQRLRAEIGSGEDARVHADAVQIIEELSDTAIEMYQETQ